MFWSSFFSFTEFGLVQKAKGGIGWFVQKAKGTRKPQKVPFALVSSARGVSSFWAEAYPPGSSAMVQAI